MFCGIQLLFLTCETSSVTGWKLGLNSVFLISLAVLKSNQAAGRQPPAHSVRNSDTEQCAGTVVAVWLPDARLPRHGEAVHGTLQQADPGESRSKEFGQGARSRSVSLCYLLVKVNIFWEVMVCVLVVRNQLALFRSYCFAGTWCLVLVNFQMETAGSSKIFLSFNQTTGCHITEHCQKNLIYYVSVGIRKIN